MEIARRYELHNEKVIKYFTSKYREHVDDYLLVIDLQNDQNPWAKLLNFLHCQVLSSSSNDDSNHDSTSGDISNASQYFEFPTVNKAPDNQPSAMIPRDMMFDWKNYKYRNELQTVFNMSEKYYQAPYSMEYEYYASIDDRRYVNLFENVYNELKREIKLSDEL